jgi:hypothetical protein
MGVTDIVLVTEGVTERDSDTVRVTVRVTDGDAPMDSDSVADGVSLTLLVVDRDGVTEMVCVFVTLGVTVAVLVVDAENDVDFVTDAESDSDAVGDGVTDCVDVDVRDCEIDAVSDGGMYDADGDGVADGVGDDDGLWLGVCDAVCDVVAVIDDVEEKLQRNHGRAWHVRIRKHVLISARFGVGDAHLVDAEIEDVTDTVRVEDVDVRSLTAPAMVDTV